MFLDKFLSKIGGIFSGLFNSAKKTWNKLSPEIQNAMLHGSGVIATINKYVGETPQFVIDIIKQKFPDLPIEKLTEGLNKVAAALNIAEGINDTDLEATIKKLQDYLAGQKGDGKLWATISHAAASILSVIIAPPETRVAQITSLLEFVYQHFIKKEEDVQPTA